MPLLILLSLTLSDRLKKASDNRSAPFTRALSALYTSATYVDEIGVDPLTTSGATATLMAIVEDKPSKFADAKVKIGLVAVVPSTGQVVYDGASGWYPPLTGHCVLKNRERRVRGRPDARRA